MELWLKAVGADLLLLREDGQCEGKRSERSDHDQAQVQTNGQSLGDGRAGLGHDPPVPRLLVLDMIETHGGEDHDGAVVEDTAGRGFVDGKLGGYLTPTQGGHRVLRLALGGQLGLLVIGEDGSDVNASDDFAPAHKEDVESTGGCDSSKGYEALEDIARALRHLEPGNSGVQAQSHGARGRDGNAVRLEQVHVRHGGRLVRVRVVDGHVHGLVSNLPADGTYCAQARREHARCHNQVREDEA